MNERRDERVAQYLRLYSCLFQTTVLPAPQVTSLPPSTASSSTSSSRSASPRAVIKSGLLACHLPFCEAKCDVETHHPLLRALSTCIGALSSSSSSSSSAAVEEEALGALEAVVVKWETEAEDGWKRTSAINEMAKMKEYYYPLLHTATGKIFCCRFLGRRV